MNFLLSPRRHWSFMKNCASMCCVCITLHKLRKIEAGISKIANCVSQNGTGKPRSNNFDKP